MDVMLVQELSVSAGGTADGGLGDGVHANNARRACVVLPQCLRRHVVESEMSAEEWCAV